MPHKLDVDLHEVLEPFGERRRLPTWEKMMWRIQSSNLALALVVVSATNMVACRLVETGAGSVGGNPSNFTFTEIVPDIYHAQGVGDIVAMSNAGIVINDEDVLIVDSHVSPAAADVLLEDLKTITDKPVRFVVNTHWHMDHSHGNQVYPSEVEIIGHEASRAAMVTGRSNSGRAYETFIGSVPGRIEAMEGALDTIGDPGLFSIKYIMGAIVYRLGAHASWVRSEVGLRQPKAADGFALLQVR